MSNGMKIAKTSRNLDTVRPSRDGHEYREAWTARMAMQLTENLQNRCVQNRPVWVGPNRGVLNRESQAFGRDFLSDNGLGRFPRADAPYRVPPRYSFA
jgi:hypothetical protein